jgi:hypothetical protein
VAGGIGRYRGEDDLELAVAEAMAEEEKGIGDAVAPQLEGDAGGGHTRRW